MLDQVMTTIQSLNNDTFEDHFVKYIMHVQDMCIDTELHIFKLLNSAVTPLGVIDNINTLVEGMNEKC